MAPDGGISFHDPNVHVGDSLWLGLPPLQVRRGVKRVSISDVRFASRYPGVMIRGTGRISLKESGDRLITTVPVDEMQASSIRIAGPYVGATERPGNPVEYGAVLAKFTEPGTFDIENVVIGYRTASGSGRQLIPCEFKITVSR